MNCMYFMFCIFKYCMIKFLFVFFLFYLSIHCDNVIGHVELKVDLANGRKSACADSQLT